MNLPLKIKSYLLISQLLLLLTGGKLNAQPSLAWKYQYNGQGDYNDRFICLTSDAEGNVYAAGSTVNIGTDRDYLIQKTDASGNVIWRTEYNASGSGPDEVQAIVVDASQNVYVTGFGKSADVGNDFLTMKLNPGGTITWISVYNYDGANAYDQANSIALDGNGNVIVTGQSDQDASSITNDDYLTIKYSNAGVQSWIVRYNGLGNGIDRAVKVVVDNADNIYVTGRSYNGNDDDYATIKYDVNGNQQWLKYGDRTHHDRAQAMTIDGNNNIYVTGWSSNGANHDYYTIKYNSSGAEQWAKVFDNVDDDEANAIFVDASGNVYITGQSDGDATAFVNLNYRTVMYDQNGLQQWSKSYDGTAGNDDVATSISVSETNVYVTGYSDADITPVVSNDILTIQYSSVGTQLWTSAYAGSGANDDIANALLTDASGEVFVSGYTEDSQGQRNAIVLKYDNSGSQLFAKIFNGIGDNSDNIRDVKIDPTGNLYITGYTVRREHNRDFFTIKITASGDTVWSRYINGSTPDSEDEADACAVDNDGNLVATGFTKNSGTSGDYTTVKMEESSGDSLWLRFYDSPIHEYDKAYDMGMDASGNIYVTGRTDSDPSIFSNDDATTIKYDGSGNLLWVKTYSGAGNGADRGSFIRVSSTGDVYVAGRTFNGSNDDLLLIKYNNSGVQQWVKTYDGGFGNEDIRGIEKDVNENIYLLANSAGSPTDTADILILKYSAGGQLLWSKRINSGGGDEANDISLDINGNVIIAGTADNGNSASVNLDAVAAKFDADGNEIWINTFDGGLDDLADAITCDQYGNTYLAVHSNKGTSADLNYDIEIIRYNGNGSITWETSWGGSSDTLDAANLIYLVNGDLYVGGSTWQADHQRDILLLKYSSVTGIGAPMVDRRVSVFPNPSSGLLTVHSDGFNANSEIRIVDLAGCTVFHKSFEGSQTMITLPDQLAPGIYFCNILSNQIKIYSEKIIYQPKM